MGGVFFRRRWAARREVIYQRRVARCCDAVQDPAAALSAVLGNAQIPDHVAAGVRALAVRNPDTLTDLERAGRFLYLQRLAFGGKVASRSFGIDSGSSRFDVTKLGPLLDEIHERLAGVVIECL